MRSKAKADAALAGLIGRGSYGGTSLMRGLAGLPLVLPLPGKAAERFPPIAADDLAHGIAHLAARDEPARTTLYAAGTETVSIRDILVAYRAWLGFGRAPEVTIPLPLLSLLRFGDIAGFLGHDTSARSTFSETLAAWPATLQDRLHARSFFAVPLLQVTLALFWILRASSRSRREASPAPPLLSRTPVSTLALRPLWSASPRSQTSSSARCSYCCIGSEGQGWRSSS